MRATASATRRGSSSSGGPTGLPEGTAQKPQARVQMSPRIMKVAVPCSQHSPMFGQRALSQTVCRSSVRMMRFRSWWRWPPKNLTRSQSGRGGGPGEGHGTAGAFEMMLNGVVMGLCAKPLFYAYRSTWYKPARRSLNQLSIPVAENSPGSCRRKSFSSVSDRSIPCSLSPESNIHFLSYTQAEREDHEALCPCLVSPLPGNHGVPADDFAQPPRKTQNRGMRDFGDGGETSRERAVENRDGTASEPAGSCAYHLGAHRRGWPVRVEGNRSRALPAEGKPHGFCDPGVWPEDGQ